MWLQAEIPTTTIKRDSVFMVSSHGAFVGKWFYYESWCYSIFLEVITHLQTKGTVWLTVNQCPGFEIHTGFDRVTTLKLNRDTWLFSPFIHIRLAHFVGTGVCQTLQYLSRYLCTNWLIVLFIITVWRLSACLLVNAILSGRGISLSGSFTKYTFFFFFSFQRPARGMQLNV